MLAALFLTLVLGVAYWLSELIRRADATIRFAHSAGDASGPADAQGSADDPKCRRRRGGALICCAIRFDEHPGSSGARSPVVAGPLTPMASGAPVRAVGSSSACNGCSRARVSIASASAATAARGGGGSAACSAERAALRHDVDGTRAVLHTSSAAEIARALTANRDRLMAVDLRSNRLTARCAELLAAGIAGDRTLTALNLHHNQLGSDGVVHLTRVLRGSALQSLDVSENGVEWRGVWALSTFLVGEWEDAAAWGAAAAPDPDKATVAADEPHAPVQAQAQVQAPAHVQLQHLNVSDNFVEDEGVRLLAAALTRNRSLTSLRLDRVGCCDAGVRALAVKLKHVTAPLRELTLDDNEHTQSGCNAMVGALQATPRPPFSPLHGASTGAAAAPVPALLPVGCAHVPLERLSLWSGALDWHANERVRVGVCAALRVNAATRQRVVWNTMRVAVTTAWMRANANHPLRNSVLPVVANCVLPLAAAHASAVS